MNELRNQLHGLWLPLVTPFRDGELDQASLRRLVRHYARQPIDGLILAATSGEGLTLDGAELEQVVMLARAELDDHPRHLPLCLGLSGADTRRMRDQLDETAAWPIDGYLIASPYYSRPSQRGLLHHFNGARRSCLMADRPLQHPLSHLASISPTRRCFASPSTRTSSG